jgi:hypothetical protein
MRARKWTTARAARSAPPLSAQPGFVADTVGRTGEWEVVAVTVFQGGRALETAIKVREKILTQPEPAKIGQE